MAEINLVFKTTAELAGAQQLQAQLEKQVGKMEALKLAGKATEKQLEKLAATRAQIAQITPAIESSSKALKDVGEASGEASGETHSRHGGFSGLAKQVKIFGKEAGGIPGVGIVVHMLRHPILMVGIALGLLVEKFKEVREEAGKAMAEVMDKWSNTKFEFPELKEAASYKDFLKGLDDIAEKADSVTASLSRANTEIARNARLTGDVSKSKLDADLETVKAKALEWEATGGRSGLSPQAAASKKAALERQYAADSEAAKKQAEDQKLSATESAAQRARDELSDSTTMHGESMSKAERARRGLKGYWDGGTYKEGYETLAESDKENWKNFQASTKKFSYDKSGKTVSVDIPPGMTGKTVRESWVLQAQEYRTQATDADTWNKAAAFALRKQAEELEGAVAEIDRLKLNTRNSAQKLEEHAVAAESATKEMAHWREKMNSSGRALSELEAVIDALKDEMKAEAEAGAAIGAHKDRQQSEADRAAALQSTIERNRLEKERDRELQNIGKEFLDADPKKQWELQDKASQIQGGFGPEGEKFWRLHTGRIESAGQNLSRTSGADAVGQFSDSVVGALDAAQQAVEGLGSKLAGAQQQIEAIQRKIDASYTG